MNALMGTRNATTRRTLFWGLMILLGRPKLSRSSPSAAEADWGPWTRAQERSKVNRCASKC